MGRTPSKIFYSIKCSLKTRKTPIRREMIIRIKVRGKRDEVSLHMGTDKIQFITFLVTDG
jgi:hypothetical protein